MNFRFGSVRMWVNYKANYMWVNFISAALYMVTVRRRRSFAPWRRNGTLRHVSKKALACDNDSMSGGTTGNVLNAIDIDQNEGFCGGAG